MSSPHPSARFSTPPARDGSSRPASSCSDNSHPSRSSRVSFAGPQVHVPPDSYAQPPPPPPPDSPRPDISTLSAASTSLSGSHVAVLGSKGRVGAVVYNKQQNKLFYLPDQQDSSNWDTLKCILKQTEPVKVWSNVSSEQPFARALERHTKELAADADTMSIISGDTDTADPLEWLVKHEFRADLVKDVLKRVYVIGQDAEPAARTQFGESDCAEDGRGDGGARGGARGEASDHPRTQRLVSQIGDSPLALGCAHALIDNVERMLSGRGACTAAKTGLVVNGFELLRLDELMMVSTETLVALNIFKPEPHGSSFKKAETKEGASLFGMMDIAKSPMGKQRLRYWYANPSRSIDTINNRQNAIECLLRAENYVKASKLQDQLKMVRNAPTLLRIIVDGSASLVNWKSFYNFSHAAQAVHAIVQKELSNRHRLVIFDAVLDRIDVAAFCELGVAMSSVIDWDESVGADGPTVAVRSGLHDQLDRHRRVRDSLPAMLTQIATKLSLEVPPVIADTLAAVYYPQMGYLIAVDWDGSPESIQAEIEGSFLTWVFSSETKAYLKAPICVELDQEIGDIANICIDEEIEIIEQLIATVTSHQPAVLDASDVIADLDAIVAMAIIAHREGWIKPEILDEPILRIKAGRHPIVEKFVETFIPNDIAITGGHGVGSDFMSDSSREKTLTGEDSIFIVTGANYSGKSVYIKQAAVLTIMAHVGSFIPAARAKIGLTDRILAKLVTSESITSAESAFMIDLNQIGHILTNATERSLVILDEIGKGTTAHDGAGVFAGTVQVLVSRGNCTPRTLIATHFQNVFRHNLLDPCLPIGIAHMQVTIPESDRAQAKRRKADEALISRISYLYSLAPGLAISSQAAACALLFGLEQDVVEEAAEVTGYLDRFELDMFLVDHPYDAGKQHDYEQGERTARRLLKWEREDHPLAADNNSQEALRQALAQVNFILDGELAAVDKD